MNNPYVKKLSVYLSYLLRHAPETLHLAMDEHGWVSVNQLIAVINQDGRYTITKELLDSIVREDEKGRYRYNEKETKIKACQGHSLKWVKPEIVIETPPAILYHGTTLEAYNKIMQSKKISKMSRHAVHLYAEIDKARQSAKRRRKPCIVLAINAAKMAANGYVFGVSENGVWLTEMVPTEYILET